MTFEDKPDEAELIRELLAEAHGRIRELQFQVDQLTEELLTIRLSDRRRATGFLPNSKRERRIDSVRITELDVDRRGRGRRSGSN
jgi:hypothetical protein